MAPTTYRRKQVNQAQYFLSVPFIMCPMLSSGDIFFFPGKMRLIQSAIYFSAEIERSTSSGADRSTTQGSDCCGYESATTCCIPRYPSYFV
jgi:hypothetical protein